MQRLPTAQGSPPHASSAKKKYKNIKPTRSGLFSGSARMMSCAPGSGKKSDRVCGRQGGGELKLQTHLTEISPAAPVLPRLHKLYLRERPTMISSSYGQPQSWLMLRWGRQFGCSGRTSAFNAPRCFAMPAPRNQADSRPGRRRHRLPGAGSAPFANPTSPSSAPPANGFARRAFATFETVSLCGSRTVSG